MRRLTAAIAAAVLVLFGSVALAGAASGDPVEVTITAPGKGGEDTTPLVVGTNNTSLPVHLTVNDIEVSVINPAMDGSWSFQLTDPLPRGESSFIRAQVYENLGEVIGEAQLIYTPWLEKQTLRIASPSGGDVLGIMFEVRSIAEPDPYLETKLLVDGVEQGEFNGYDGDGVLVNRIEDVSGGTHALQVRATDRYGRLIESAPIQVKVDATAPTKPTIDSPSSGAVIREGETVFEGTGDPGTELKLAIDGSGERLGVATVDARGHWSIPLDTKTEFTWARGKLVEDYRIVARSRDDHDNVSFSDVLTVDIDLRTATTPPTRPATPPTSKPAGSAVPAAVPAADPASAPVAAPELANTGQSTLPGTAAALLLIATGLGLTTVSRRLAPTRR